MRRSWKEYRNDNEGATAIEYAILVAILATAVIGFATSMGQTLNNNFDRTADVIGESQTDLSKTTP